MMITGSAMPSTTAPSKQDQHAVVDDATWAALPGMPEIVPGAPSLRERAQELPYTYASAYEHTIPAGVRPFDYCRERRIILVRRFQVECANDPTLAPIRCWAEYEGAAKQTFFIMHRIKHEVPLTLSVVDIGPEGDPTL